MNKGVQTRRIRTRSRTESERSTKNQEEELRQEKVPLTPPCEEYQSPEGEDVEGDYCRYHDLPPPPDGGWGWVIVVASFMCNLIVDGVAYTFGVFIVKYEEYFREGKGKTAWVGSLLCGVYLSAGPLVSALTNKFGCRAVCVSGSVVGCLAFVLSTFSPTVDILMLTYGIMGGIGFGLIYLPAVVCVGYYFETKRALATGIAVCGSGVGTFVFAPLASALLDVYDWKGANLILAGIILNCAVFGALMRPLEYPKNSKCKPLLQRMADEKRYYMERGSISGSAYFMVKLPDGTLEKRFKIPLNADPGVHSSFNLDQLVPGSPMTPLPTVATLPTICEAKAVEGLSGSSNESANTSQEGSTEIKEKGKSDGNEEKKAETSNKLANGTVSKTVTESNKVAVDMSTNEKHTNEKEEDTKSLTPSMTSPTKSPRNSVISKANGVSPTVWANLPRNGSQPVFSTSKRASIPKNGSVPLFEVLMKKHKIPNIFKSNQSNCVTQEEMCKHSLQLRMPNSSIINGKNNNCSCEDVWIEIDGDNETISITSSNLKQERNEMVRPLSRKDIFYSGSILHLPEYQSQKSLSSYRQSITSIPRCTTQTNLDQVDGKKLAQKPDICPCLPRLPESFMKTLSEMMDFSLLKNPVFLFIGISNVFGMLGFFVPFVYIMDSAILKGVDSQSAAFLLSIIGITNTVGRVFSGWISDFPQVDSLLVNNLCILLSGLCVFVVPFCNTYAMYSVVAVFFGLFVSAFIALTSIVLVDYLGIEYLTSTFGLICLLRGMAGVLGPPVAGAVFDATKSYDISFWMAGSFLFFASIISFMVLVMKKFCTPKVILAIEQDDQYLPDEPYIAPDAPAEVIATTATPEAGGLKNCEQVSQMESTL